MDSRKLWGRYVAWLEANAPDAFGNLAPPASDAQIVALEATIGRAVPDEVKAVWRLNNGQKRTMIAGASEVAPICLPSLSFLSVELVAKIWNSWRQLRDDEDPIEFSELQATGESRDPGVIQPLYSHPGWIPLWSDPVRPDYVGLDMAPDAKGTVGQIINFGRDEETHYRWASNLTELLAILIEQVESGGWPATEVEFALSDGRCTRVGWIGHQTEHFFRALFERWDAKRNKTLEERATECRHAGNLEQAAELLEGALESQERSPRIAKWLIHVYEKLRRHRDAERAYRHALELEPDSAKLAHDRANNLLFALGDYPAAESALREAATKFPHDSDIAFSLGMAVGYYQGRFAEGARLFQRVVELEHGNPSYMGNWAYMLAAAGRVEEVMAIINRVLHESGVLDPHQAGNWLECRFYEYALCPAADRDTALGGLYLELSKGTRGEDWNFAPVIEVARALGHPEADWLTPLARVVNDQAEIHTLARWPRWASMPDLALAANQL